MSVLPSAIHSVAQVRALDDAAIHEAGIPAYALMERAAAAALAALRAEWPRTLRLLVLCGYGNNAGDGYVLARLARKAQLQVGVIALGDPVRLQGAALQAWQEFVASGGATQSWQPDCLQHAEVIVDAVLGTGLCRPLNEFLQGVVNEVNCSGKPVLALDIPSGLDADTGAVLGAAIRAHRTIGFVGLKQGYYLGQGPEYVGKLLFDDLAIPPSLQQRVASVAERLEPGIVQRALPRRSRITHKGQQGHVLIIGGGLGMAGAVRLAGEACLRVGAGLVSIATRPEHAAALVASRPELMCRGVLSVAELNLMLSTADLIAIGPGLGQDEWAKQLLAAALACDKPLVVDADALNLLAKQPGARGNWILTPHPGEAARLLSTSTVAVQSARLAALHDLQTHYDATVVLKGAGTLVAAASQLPALCDRGNPGMAAPGMGDVLTGIIAGIAAQVRLRDDMLWLAARAGVYVHAVAGDMAARHGERGMIASDLIAHLPACVNP